MAFRILAMDTTAEIGSIALADGAALIEEVLLHSPDGHGHVLFERVQGLLARHALKAGDIDLFAAASGPGSFTGVRVGLAAVKGLGATLEKPVAAISNLRAVASFGSAAVRAAILDARRGEIYGGVYSAVCKLLGDEVVMKFPAWLASLPEEVTELVAQDWVPFRAALPFGKYETAVAPRALASAIARLAHTDHLNGVVQPAAAIDANYVRRSDAELFWQDK